MTRVIGNTATVRLCKIEKRFNLGCKLYAKCEHMNPGGSIKDRVAKAILEDAKRRGQLREGYTVAEATSGNMGIALAMIGAKEGYRVKITMPSSASAERIELIRAYGGEVITTDATLGMRGAILEVEKMSLEHPDVFVPDQFKNRIGVLCHRATTAREICSDMECNINYFISGVGTGATLSGVGGYLKEKYGTRVIAIEPKELSVLSGECPNSHGIEGIGAGFIPPLLGENDIDGIARISYSEAVEMVRELARSEGILAGISTGANIAASIRIGRETTGSVVTIIADRGERYFSRGIFYT